ncbi:MAG: NAD-dependent epimerase/dehydratase family protein [Acidobacteria bacterium]|nr:NAD-dependent epimerase/dehydratase family protein [Acidobacteriota bacterium]
MDAAARPIAVVTGGTGFIGWALCEALRDAGWCVRAVVRPTSSNPLPEGVERYDANLDAAALGDACAGAQVVFHLAGLTRARTYEEFHSVNADGAAEVARAARRADAFFVLVSSQAAAGPGTVDNVRMETDPEAPLSDYGRSKLAGEHAVRAIAGLRYSIIRPPGVYGPRDKDFLVLFRSARRGLLPRLGSASKAYTLIHVSDVVGALLAVARTGREDPAAVDGLTAFIGHSQPVTQGELLQSIARAVDKPRALRLPVPLGVLRVLAEFGELQGAVTGRPAVLNRSRFRELSAPGFVCNVERIADATGWRAAIGFDAGMKETARWYIAEEWV